MRLAHLLPVVLVVVTLVACSRTAPPENVQTRAGEQLPPSVCDLQKVDDGHETLVTGTLHLEGAAATLGDPRCPSIHVVLTGKTAVQVNFASVGDGVLVRLRGTYHRGELAVAWIEPEAAFQ